MALIAWIILGLVAGLIVSRMSGRIGRNLQVDIALGIVGAVICSWLFSLLGLLPMGGPGHDGTLPDVIGAAATLVFIHALFSGAR